MPVLLVVRTSLAEPSATGHPYCIPLNEVVVFEKVAIPDTVRAVVGFVVPMPTKPEGSMVMPEDVALKAPAGVSLKEFD